MGTEDDLKRLGQAAAALAGVAAARAKEAAEQLLGSREKARSGAKHKAENLVEEGRHAAAEVIGALRRETSVILHDLQKLEKNLRSDQHKGGHSSAAAAGEATTSATKKAAPVKKSATAKATSATKKTAAAKKAAAPAKKAAATKTTAAVKKTVAVKKAVAAKKAVPAKKAVAVKRVVPASKAAGARKAGGPRKAAGTAGRPSEGTT